jgi:HEAT repeat protein
MLGNGDAAPALVRIATREKEAPLAARTARVAPGGSSIELELTALRNARSIATSAAGTDVQLAALLALARLGDPRARGAFLRFTGPNSDNRFRAIAIWGLGRLSDAGDLPELMKALDGRQGNVVAAACLGLGRQPSPASLQPLFALAADSRRPTEARRAAIIGLGHASARSVAARDRASPALVELLDSGDQELVEAAAMALAWSRDPRGLLPLLARALLPHRFALADSSIPLEALAAWQAGAAPPDEARQLTGPLLDVDALLSLPAPAPPADLTALWRGHTRGLQELLADALAHGGDVRRDALAALDDRPDAPGLGALTPEADGPISPETAAATREIVQPLADRLAALLDEPDAETRASALRVLAKLGDERVTPGRIAAAVFDASPALAGAAAFAAARVSTTRPAQAPAIAAALTPALSDESWRRRMAAVDALAGVGPAGVALLERTRADKHAVVRAAALDALAKKPY